MPKLERLDWIAPLSEGKGVTLSDDPEADLFLAEDPNALLLGVLYDSQFQTRRAFAVPLKLKGRLGHFDIARIAADDPESFAAVFSDKPALHRFPRRSAQLTQRFAEFVVETYGGDSSRIWSESASAGELGERLMALPAFGLEKTNWTVGMLGRLGSLSFGGWEEYRFTPKKRQKAS